MIQEATDIVVSQHLGEMLQEIQHRHIDFQCLYSSPKSVTIRFFPIAPKPVHP